MEPEKSQELSGFINYFAHLGQMKVNLKNNFSNQKCVMKRMIFW